ncbi:hypothetical protein A4G19_15340 [Pasteurellaceae bacterium Macca]|nr:hypothetical protein [Pasteurellaceae bacterium Macca]
MYQAVVHFSYQHFEQDPVSLISQILEQWRYNGQVIGREMGITHHQRDTRSTFQARVALPEQESLQPKWHSDEVNEAIEQAKEAGVVLEYVELIGRDYNAEETSTETAPFFVLYTTHLESCSPLYNGVDFRPVPLYRLKQDMPLNEALIKWQENWQACDQLQMNGTTLEVECVAEISNPDTPLSQQGRALAKQVERLNHTPTFYYLYRLGADEQAEAQRRCPSCGGEWKLPEPRHGIFHFQCQPCRLISNWSWELL